MSKAASSSVRYTALSPVRAPPRARAPGRRSIASAPRWRARTAAAPGDGTARCTAAAAPCARTEPLTPQARKRGEPTMGLDPRRPAAPRDGGPSVQRRLRPASRARRDPPAQRPAVRDHDAPRQQYETDADLLVIIPMPVSPQEIQVDLLDKRLTVHTVARRDEPHPRCWPRRRGRARRRAAPPPLVPPRIPDRPVPPYRRATVRRRRRRHPGELRARAALVAHALPPRASRGRIPLQRTPGANGDARDDGRSRRTRSLAERGHRARRARLPSSGRRHRAVTGGLPRRGRPHPRACRPVEGQRLALFGDLQVGMRFANWRTCRSARRVVAARPAAAAARGRPPLHTRRAAPSRQLGTLVAASADARGRHPDLRGARQSRLSVARSAPHPAASVRARSARPPIACASW